MHPIYADRGINKLRVVSQWISTTPTGQLPQVTNHLAAFVSQSTNQLCSSAHGKSVQGSDHEILLHKYKTQLSTLLQDKDPRARFAAAVLVKSTIEAGDIELLKQSSRWVGSLISILGKPDPVVTKKICILTLTRIFKLSQQNQQIVREVATPALPGFLTACLKVLSNSADSSLSVSTIQALLELLPLHPASFRPFVSQLQGFLLPYLAPTPSYDVGGAAVRGSTAPALETLSHNCRMLYVGLTSCAAKDKSNEAWTKLLTEIVGDAHFTCDRNFRAFSEDWSHAKYLRSHARDHDPGDLELPPQSSPRCRIQSSKWKGLTAGMEKLEGMLKIQQCFLISSTSSPVTLPLNDVLDLMLRILNIAIQNDWNPGIDRIERETLQLLLPYIQSCVADLSTLLLQRLTHSSAGFVFELLEPIFAISETNWWSTLWQEAYAVLLTEVFCHFGPSMPSHLKRLISNELAMICHEALSKLGLESSSTNQSRSLVENALPSGRSHPSSIGIRTGSSAKDQPNKLLHTAILRLPSNYLSSTTRKSIEQVAILKGDKELLLACTLNPFTNASSSRQNPTLLPFLARAHPGSPEVEALMRPRMAPIRTSGQKVDEMEREEVAELDVHGYAARNSLVEQNDTADHGEEANHIAHGEHHDTSMIASQAQPPTSIANKLSTTPTLHNQSAFPDFPSPDTTNAPSKRPYTESHGAYTVHLPNRDNYDNLDDLEDDDPPHGLPQPVTEQPPAAKKPRIEEAEGSAPLASVGENSSTESGLPSDRGEIHGGEVGERSEKPDTGGGLAMKGFPADVYGSDSEESAIPPLYWISEDEGDKEDDEEEGKDGMEGQEQGGVRGEGGWGINLGGEDE